MKKSKIINLGLSIASLSTIGTIAPIVASCNKNTTVTKVLDDYEVNKVLFNIDMYLSHEVSFYYEGFKLLVDDAENITIKVVDDDGNTINNMSATIVKDQANGTAKVKIDFYNNDSCVFFKYFNLEIKYKNTTQLSEGFAVIFNQVKFPPFEGHLGCMNYNGKYWYFDDLVSSGICSKDWNQPIKFNDGYEIPRDLINGEFYLNPDKNIESIPDHFLYHCPGASLSEIPTSVKTIGDNFLRETKISNVPNLKKGSALVKIGNNFLQDCTNCGGPNPIEISFPNTLTTIGDNFLGGCSRIQVFNKFNLGSGLVSIGNGFMSGCSSIKYGININFPDTLEKIGDSFLSECSSFDGEVTLGNGVKEIGFYFMNNCSSFNHPITIPAGVTTINSGFMSGCSSFNQPITVPSGITNIGESFLENCWGFNSDVQFNCGANLQPVGRSFMSECRNMTSTFYIGDKDCNLDAFNFDPMSGRMFISYGAKGKEPNTYKYGVQIACNDANATEEEKTIKATTLVLKLGRYNHDSFCRRTLVKNDPFGGHSAMSIDDNYQVHYYDDLVDSNICWNGEGTADQHPITDIEGHTFDRSTFNQRIYLSNSVATISEGFLRECTSFNHGIVLPNYLLGIKDYFLYNCKAMVGTITINQCEEVTKVVDLFGETNHIMATDDDNAAMYTTGIKIASNTAQQITDVKNKCPDSNISPFRKLI